MAKIEFIMSNIERHLHETNIPFANSQLLAKVVQRDIQVSSLPGVAEVYSTVFSAKVNEAPGPGTFNFKRPTFSFRSDMSPQILVIKIPDLNRNTSPGRFKVVGVEYDRPDLIHASHYEDTSQNGALKHFNGIISNVPRSIMLQFRMSTVDKTPAFGVYLVVEDTKTNETFRCDPQVGNDPP